MKPFPIFSKIGSIFFKKKNSQKKNDVKTGTSLNNPGNIRKSATTYEGETQSNSPSFKSFSSLAYGYRAMIVILRYYFVHHGDKTLSDMIYRYAPPMDNNPTDAYIDFISQETGINPFSDAKDWLYNPKIIDIVISMSKFEQGKNFVADSQAATEGFNMA